MGRHRRPHPIDTLTLPYACGDPSCPCAQARTDHENYRVTVRPDRGGWRAAVVNESGMVVDLFRDHTLNGALEAVHREFPWATFDPEPEEAQ